MERKEFLKFCGVFGISPPFVNLLLGCSKEAYVEPNEETIIVVWDTLFWDNEQCISHTPEIRHTFTCFVNVTEFYPTVNALITFGYADYGHQTETMSDS